MSIHQELADELRDAIKSRDRPRADVVRQIETEVSVAKSAPGFEGDVDDDLYLRVMSTYTRQIRKAREEFAAAGERGADHVAKLDYEVEFLSKWLPEAIDEESTRSIVADAIRELGVDDPKLAGKVVGHIMRSGTEGLDGAVVNRLVEEALGGE